MSVLQQVGQHRSMQRMPRVQHPMCIQFITNEPFVNCILQSCMQGFLARTGARVGNQDRIANKFCTLGLYLPRVTGWQ